MVAAQPLEKCPANQMRGFNVKMTGFYNEMQH